MLIPLSRALFKAQGWKLQGEHLSKHRRAVVIGAPHTSNWDMVCTLAAFDMLGLPLRFTIKRSWMRFPWRLIIEPAGGIKIDRRPREKTGERPSMVEAMIQLFEENPDELALVVTPEGTRSRTERWHSGFYWVAVGAEVPILLGYVDYAKKEAGVGKVLFPSGDFEADMREITAFYETVTPLHPELFSVDKRFG